MVSIKVKIYRNEVSRKEQKVTLKIAKSLT